MDPDARHVLEALLRARLPEPAWVEVGSLLATLDESGSIDRLRQLAFEGQVAARLGSPAGTRAPAVVPTRQTSVLPLVGLVCGASIVVIGFLIGGGVLALATAVFGLFVFGVAMAGSRVTHRSPGPAPTAAVEDRRPPPPTVRAALDAALARPPTQ